MRICTYTTDLGETIQAMTADEWQNGGREILDNADEYVWQEQPDKQTAIYRHEAAFEAWSASNQAGMADLETY